ncbi:hypothetical protein [Microvirga sp. G4-2]|uniref:hypothetical protein n=1 Tax=Microvirga sp. G4-2 TaxID=3434467 RepID=UPI004044FBBE
MAASTSRSEANGLPMKGSGFRLMLSRPVLMIFVAAMASMPLQSVFAQGGGEPSPFVDPDMQPNVRARCHEVRRLTQGQETGTQRMDFSVTGPLALVHFDGTLTYLGLCGTPPEPKVLCITYQTNGMQVGDVVTVSGGYSRPDEDHILLDPCLAFQADEPVQ